MKVRKILCPDPEEDHAEADLEEAAEEAALAAEALAADTAAASEEDITADRDTIITAPFSEAGTIALITVADASADFSE